MKGDTKQGKFSVNRMLRTWYGTIKKIDIIKVVIHNYLTARQQFLRLNASLQIELYHLAHRNSDYFKVLLLEPFSFLNSCMKKISTFPFLLTFSQL